MSQSAIHVNVPIGGFADFDARHIYASAARLVANLKEPFLVAGGTRAEYPVVLESVTTNLRTPNQIEIGLASRRASVAIGRDVTFELAHLYRLGKGGVK
jgi:hypothetical protein